MKKLFSYLKALISVALLAGLGWIMREKISSVGGIIANADKGLLALSGTLILAGMILQSYRLKFLLDTQKIHLKIRDVAFLTFIGQFFNNFMPTAIGGDVVKAYYASGGTEKKLETFASVAMDRILGVVTIMWIALAAVAIRYNDIQDKMIAAITAIIFIIGAIFMALIFNEKISRSFIFFKKFFKDAKLQQRLERLYEAAKKYRHNKKLIFYTLCLSLAAQLIFFLMVYILAKSIYSDVSFPFMLLTLPVIATVSMLPSINGLGIRESGFVYFLGKTMGNEKAFALSLLYLAFLLFVSAIGGVVFLFKKEFKHIIK